MEHMVHVWRKNDRRESDYVRVICYWQIQNSGKKAMQKRKSILEMVKGKKGKMGISESLLMNLVMLMEGH